MLACCGGVLANPTGPNVTAGSAAFSAAGKTLTVTNAPGTIINWQGFSIGTGELTRFNQQSAASAVLNRVIGNDGSRILGSLTSNGRVFLVNPNGIVFGPGSRIDTAGFIASTLNIADKDFLQGKLKFEGGGNGVLRNEGQIRAASDIVLVGPVIENVGLVRSESGNVLLAAGHSLTITSPNAQGVKFELQAPTDSAINLGTIEAAGAASMLAGTLRHSGDIRATTANVEGGRVVLIAQKEAIVDAGAGISASGAQGGSVTIQSGDLTSVAGRVEATGSAGPGGTIQILGNRVALSNGARIDASGETGGGTILVGGDYQGRTPDAQNAWRTFVGPDARLRADAVASGDGGKVIVWADDITRFYGSISARGGARSGDGGFVETSGKEGLSVIGARVDTTAPAGRTGTWLLDPKNIAVITGGPSMPGMVDDFSNNPFGTEAIDPASFSGSATNVVLQANNDIVFSNAVAMSGNGVGLTAQAGRSILINANISTTNGDIKLVANDPAAIAANRDAGPALLSMAPGTLIDAGTQNVRLQMGPGVPGAASGDIIVANVMGGNVSVLQNGLTANSSILRAPSGASLLTATNSLYLEHTPNGSAASIGTDPAPIPIATPRLEAHMTGGAGGIFIDSPNAGDLQIGEVPNTIFAGPIRGVQALAGGPIKLTVNGNLTRFAGTGAGCGPTGGTGGPICAVGTEGDITLTAAALGATGPGGRLHVDANGGSVTATSTTGGVFLERRNGTLSLSDYTVGTAAGQPLEIATGNGILNVNNNISAGSDAVTLIGGGPAGQISFAGGVTVAAGSLTLGSSSNVTFNSGTVTLNTPVTASAPLSIGGATLNATGDVSANTVTLSSGTINASANFTVNGAFNASGGNLTGGGVFTTGQDSVGTISGPMTLTDKAWNNGGAMTLTGDSRIALGGTGATATAFTNQGTGTIDDNSTNAFPISFSNTPNNKTFVNAGIYNKNASSAATRTIDVAVNNTGGTVNVNSGTLQFSAGGSHTGSFNVADGQTLSFTGGTHTLNTGTAFNGNTSGAVVNAGATLSVAANLIDAAAFSLNSGTLTLGAGTTLTQNKDFIWNGGTLNGTGALAMAGGTSFGFGTAGTGTGARTLGGPTLNLAATTLPAGSLTLSGGTLNTSGVFTNNATLTLSGGTFAPTGMDNAGTFTYAGGTFSPQGAAAVNNTGTLAVTAGTLSLPTNGTHTGTFSVSNGAALNFSGGTHTLSNATVLSGAGTYGVGVLTTVSFNGPTFNATGTFNNGGLLNVNSGTLNLSGGGTDTGTFNVSNGAALNFSGGTHTFHAGAALTGTGTVEVSGGTLAVVSALTVANGGPTLLLSSGTIDASANLTVNSTFNASGGTLTGGGVFTTGAGSTSTISGGITLTDKAWNNAGAMTFSGSSRIMLGGTGATATTFTNQATTGTIDDSSTNAFPITFTTTPNNKTFANAGSYTKNASAAATHVIDIAVNNSGTVNVNSGILALFGGGTDTGTFTPALGTTMRFSGGTHTFNAGAALTGSGTVEVLGGTLAVAADSVANVAAFNQTAGTLNIGAGTTLTKSAGSFNWSGGTIGGAGTLATINGAALNFTGSGARLLNGATLTAAGPTLPAGSLTLQAGTLTTTGALTINNGATMSVSGGSFSPTAAVNNAGTVNVTAGTLALPTDGTHTGVFNVSLGATLNFSGGTHSLNGGSDIAGAGNLTVSGGTITSNAPVTLTGALTVSNGTATFNAAPSALNPSTVTVSGGAANFNRAVTDAGTLTVSGGTANFNADSTVGGALSLSAGSLAGSGMLTVNGNDNTWSGGTMIGSGSTVITGANTLAITGANDKTFSARKLTTNGAVTWSGAGNIVAGNGAAFNNKGSFEIRGDANWANGGGADAVIDNTGTITRTTSSGIARLDKAVVTGGGTINVDTGTLRLSAAATSAGTLGGAVGIANGATLDIAGGNYTANASVNGATGGNLTVSGGSFTTAQPVTTSGALTVSGGIATFDPNATALPASSVTVSGTGTANFNRALADNGPLTVSGGAANFTVPLTRANAVTITAGTLGSAADITLNGPFSWSGGTVSGAGVLTTSATSSPTITGIVTLSDKQWNNAAALTLAGDSQLGLATTGAAPSTFTNQSGATFTDISTNPFPVTFRGRAPDNKNFVNAGTFTKSSAGPQTIDIAVNNTGTLNINTGTLTLTRFPQNDGTINLTGTTLFTGGAALVNAGTIAGSGTINLGTGTLTNAGVLSPGFSPGTLSITGNFTQGPTGVLNVEIGGLTPGSFDVLAVSGTANLGGTLNVTHIDGFNPPSDSNYAVMTYNSLVVGTDFATKNFPAGYGTFYTTVRNPKDYTLAVGAVVNEWRGPGGTGDSGNWQTGSNWSLAHAPTVGEDALINDVAGTQLVTVSGQGQAARKVTSGENLTIADTGALMLGPTTGTNLASNVSATLTVNGALILNGPISANDITMSGVSSASIDVRTGALPRLNMLSGLLTRSNAGDLTITGPFSVSGGAILLSSGKLVTLADTMVSGVVNPLSNWQNSGTLTISGAGQISPSPGSGFVFENTLAGLVNLAGGNANPFSSGIADARILNTGAFNKNSASGTQAIDTAFSNTGTGRIEVDSGTLVLSKLTDGTVPNTQSGTIRVAPGTTLSTGGNNLTNLAGGVVGGRGTLDLGAGTLTNEGDLQPGRILGGFNTGTLTIAGNFVQGAGGTVAVQVGGTAAGTYDVLSVTGSAALGGALAVSTLGGYVPTAGDSFTVLEAATVNGSFATITKSFPNTINPSYAPASVSLSIDAPPLNFWNFNGDGSWGDSTKWSLGHVPTPAEMAKVDRPGALTITVPTAGGPYITDRLRSEERIDIAGTLDLANASRINNVVSLIGTLQGAGAVAINGNLSIVGGTIATTGGVTVSGSTGVIGAAQISGTLTAGEFSMINGGSLDIAAAGMLNLQGVAQKTLGDGTLNRPIVNNAGTITLAGNNLSLNGANVNIAAGGRFDFRDGSDILFIGGPLSTITNAGTIAKTVAGSSPSTIGPNIALNSNGGIFSAESGTLELAANNTFNNGTQFTGAGSNLVTGNSTFGGTSTSANLTLQSGTFTGNNATLAGTTGWTGGTMTGTFAVPVGATLNLSGAAAKTADGGATVVTNSGTMTIAGPGSFVLSGGGAFTNDGTTTWNGAGGSTTINAGSTLTNNRTFNLNATVADTGITGAGVFQNNAGATVNSTAGGINTLVSSTFNNAGTVNVDGGTLRLTAGGTDTGLYAIDAGTTLDFGGGTRTLNAGSNVTGAGTMLASAGTTNVNAAYGPGTTTITGGTANFNGAGAHTTATLNLTGGTLGGTGNLAVTGTGTWTGGTIAGNLTVPAGATLNLTGAGNRTVDGAAATLATTGTGTINHTIAGNLVLNNGATLNNAGTYDIKTDGDIVTTAGAGNVVNTGTLRKSAGAGVTQIANPVAFTNSGTLSAQTGTLEYASNGNAFNNGTQLTGAGSNLVTGNSAFNGTITSANLTLQSGTFSGTASLGGATAWTGGTLAGAFTTPAGATLNLSGAGTKALSGAGASLTTNGTTNVGGSGDATLSAGALWENFGTLNLGGSARLVLGGGTATTFINRGSGVINDTTTNATPITVAGTTRTGKSFANAGTFEKDTGSADTQTLDVPMTHTGTLNIETGTLIANGFPTNNGLIHLDAGTTLSSAGNPFTNSAAGAITGNGTILAPTFTNLGSLGPGDSPGTFTIAGNYVQGPSGTLVIELGGSTAGTTYDVLKVTGSATLDGALAIFVAGGQTIATGSTYDFMSYASRNGDFATFAIPPGQVLQLVPGPTSYRISATTPPANVVTEITKVAQKDSVVLAERRPDNLLVPEQQKGDDDKKGLGDCR